MFIFFETTTHSRAAPAGIFENCADIGDLPKIEDADLQSLVNKAEQQGQTFTYDFDAEQREHLAGEIRFAVLLIKEIGIFLNELLQAQDILDNGSVLIVSRNTKSSRATDKQKAAIKERHLHGNKELSQAVELVLKLIGATQTVKHLNGQPETKHLRHLKPGAADIPKVFSAGSSGSPHKRRSRSSSRGRTKNNSRSRSHSSNSSCSSSSSRSRVSSGSSDEEVLGEQLQDLHIKTVKAEAVKAVQLHFASHQSTAAILGERLKAAEDQTEVQKQKICEQEKEIRTLQKRVATADADLRQLNQFLTAPRSIEAYPLSPTGIDALTDTAPPGTPDQLASSKKRTRDLTEK